MDAGDPRIQTTAKIENLEIKMIILNNQHLGMVVQWEDRFYKANRGHTYLGRRVPPPPFLRVFSAILST